RPPIVVGAKSVQNTPKARITSVAPTRRLLFWVGRVTASNRGWRRRATAPPPAPCLRSELGRSDRELRDGGVRDSAEVTHGMRRARAERAAARADRAGERTVVDGAARYAGRGRELDL